MTIQEIPSLMELEEQGKMNLSGLRIPYRNTIVSRAILARKDGDFEKSKELFDRALSYKDKAYSDPFMYEAEIANAAQQAIARYPSQEKSRDVAEIVRWNVLETNAYEQGLNHYSEKEKFLIAAEYAKRLAKDNIWSETEDRMYEFAINHFMSLEQFEKAGNVYAKINDDASAQKFYIRAILNKAHEGDYNRAAIIADRHGFESIAQALLENEANPDGYLESIICLAQDNKIEKMVIDELLRYDYDREARKLSDDADIKSVYDNALLERELTRGFRRHTGLYHEL